MPLAENDLVGVETLPADAARILPPGPHSDCERSVHRSMGIGWNHAVEPEQIVRLLKKVQQTREVEMSCPECLDELDKYTQRILDGEPIDGVLDQVRDHLKACPYAPINSIWSLKRSMRLKGRRLIWKASAELQKHCTVRNA